MPTGYTAAVVDGSITELEPFVWQLARGMGALVSMRDEPWGAPVPERFEPSQYNAERLAEARAEQHRLRVMTSKEAQAAAVAEVAECERNKADYFARRNAERQRYEAMITKVQAWERAPEGIKEFALEQLHRGMEFDCPLDAEKYYSECPTRDGDEWRRLKLEKCEKDIIYHAAEQAKEDARIEGRNAWLAQLRASLTPPATGDDQ